MNTSLATKAPRIQAIETHYKGYRFRSRLEARWAVFFETIGFEWRYEQQGYVSGGDSWLPDFEIEDHAERRMLVEVKGTRGALASEGDRYARLLKDGGVVCFLGDVPDPSLPGTWFHPCLSSVGGNVRHRWFTWMIHGVANTKNTFPLWALAGEDKSALAILFGLAARKWEPGDDEQWLLSPRLVETPRQCIGVSESYQAARSARFEHGEAPQTRSPKTVVAESPAPRVASTPFATEMRLAISCAASEQELDDLHSKIIAVQDALGESDTTYLDVAVLRRRRALQRFGQP